MPTSPGPVAVGSPIHSGGVSQTNASMAITIRSYCHVARSKVQNRACQTARAGNVRRRCIVTAPPLPGSRGPAT